MRLQLYNIIPQLKPYVKLICSMECDGYADTRFIRVLPDTCVELFVNYTSTPVAIIENKLHKRSIVTFRMSQPMDVQMRKGAGCLAICFHPGMAYAFFNLPMHMLSNTTVSLSDLWNGLTSEIEDKLADALNNEARVEIIQKYLLKQLAKKKPDLQIAYWLKRIEDAKGLISVSKLISDIGISQRHLSRKFQQHIGLSPQEYLRASRFLASLDLLRKHPSLSFTELAYESGYYDQAHFNREYKAFTGLTPREVLEAEHIQ